VCCFFKLNLPEVQLDKKSFFCKQCAKLKAVDLKSNSVASDLPHKNPLDLCTTDVAGPFNMDINGCRFLITMHNHASTYTFCDVMASQSKVPDKIMKWVLHLKNTCGNTPTYMQCDNAVEYIGNLKEKLAKVGTTLAPVSPYHPQQNGEAERYNHTIGNMAHTMLHAARLPKIYRSFAYLTAAYLHNRIPKKRVDTSPLQALYKVPACPDTLYPFGAHAIVTVPKESLYDKLDERGVNCHLLGYPKAGAGWLFYSPTQHRMIHTTSAIFSDFQALEVKKECKKTDIDFIVNQIKLFLGGELTDELAAKELKAIKKLPVGPEPNIPKNIKSALKSSNGSNWREAAEYELAKFDSLKVWEPVNPYAGVKFLGARWVFTVKKHPDGSIDKFCAQYVAKGFNQTLGVGCNETDAPSTLLNTLRMLMSLARQHNYATASFDISLAYLYSPIEEEVYVQLPIELFLQWKGKIMRLKKAMYGMRQAASSWWKFFHSKMESIGFVASELEPSLFICRKDCNFFVIWLHLDNGFAMALSSLVLEELHAAMSKEMEVEWSDKVDKIVGIQIGEVDGNVEMDQHMMVEQILQGYSRMYYPRRSTLPDTPLETNSGEEVNATGYRSTLGSLIYL
jgi:hypothetical protein